MDFLSKIKKRLAGYIAPLQVSTREANKRAEALIRANLRSAAKPPKVINGSIVYRSVSAGGLTSHSNSYTEPDSVIKIGGREVSRTAGSTEHDLAFSRNTSSYVDSLTPRKNLSPANAKLRQANIKYQNGVLLENVKAGDRVTANPIQSDSGRNSRAVIYSRITNGALKSVIDDNGEASIDSRRLSNTQWKNILGEKKTFNPEDLKKDLTNLAAGQIVRRLAGHPAAQAYLQVDNAVKATTGEGLTERIGRGHRATTQKSIEERLKKGERYFVPQALPF